jgi:hypothetical protein
LGICYIFSPKSRHWTIWSVDLGITLTLAANLHHRSLVKGAFRERYEIFARELLESYGCRLLQMGCEWISRDTVDGYLRGLWIINGRELINSTTWRRRCDCRERQCQHNREAVRRGVDYVLGALETTLDVHREYFLKPLYSSWQLYLPYKQGKRRSR